ncbi:four-helix bundle copper-binding protein [Membranicola marinus]|uniref:Four-helix bundle copper-binding protein n=1 Tax=Membranihabitans marinus TaxID=1227546 RepID=A0A953HS27_9BACT|nr:four-helix bundle copper-binding protein [Membranihabitans marinus]MBY5956868.1 four-helix bundle copper-binding protein [Membranihabitans marinus]
MRNTKIIHALGNCINHCNYCADACLSEDNVKMMVDCIRLDRVCAEVCSTLSQVLSTEYDDVNELVAYCKSTCEKCAAECSKHDHDHCQACAQACRECAEACEEYLSAN